MTAVKHPLAYAWTFWLEPDARCAHKHKRWLDSLSKLPSFDFVEDFWGLWAVLPRPSVLLDSSIYLFRSDRPPSWELFPGGGKWVATGAELDIDMAWELLCLAMLGEQLEEDVCGGVCSARRLSVWTRGGPSAQRDSGSGSIHANTAAGSMKACIARAYNIAAGWSPQHMQVPRVLAPLVAVTLAGPNASSRSVRSLVKHSFPSIHT